MKRDVKLCCMGSGLILAFTCFYLYHFGCSFGFSCLSRLYLVQLDSSGVWLFGLETAGVTLFLL